MRFSPTFIDVNESASTAVPIHNASLYQKHERIAARRSLAPNLSDRVESTNHPIPTVIWNQTSAASGPSPPDGNPSRSKAGRRILIPESSINAFVAVRDMNKIHRGG
jgi:hypothetical protein